MCETPINCPADIPADQCIWVVPPVFHSILTGVKHARVMADGTVTLTYTDDTEERGDRPLDRKQPIPCLVGLIEHVQRQRGAIGCSR